MVWPHDSNREESRARYVRPMLKRKNDASSESKLGERSEWPEEKVENCSRERGQCDFLEVDHVPRLGDLPLKGQAPNYRAADWSGQG